MPNESTSTASKLPHLPGPPPNSVNQPIAPKGAQLVFPSTRLTFLTSQLIRFESSPDGKFEDRASTFALNRNLPVPKLNVEHKADGGVEITTDELRVIYDGKALTENGLSVGTIHKLSPKQNQETWRWGQHARGNLGGTARTLDTVDGRIDMGDGILATGGFAIIDDSTTMLFTSEGWVDARVPGRTDHYLFGYGRDYTSALRDFYKVSGDVPVVPRWALGNWWSRYHAYSDEEYLGLMDKFNEEKIPLSVGVLDMDWHIVDDVPEEYGGGWTGYTWNKKLFPDPKGFMKKLHDRNLRITPNTHPADGFRAFEDVYKKACELLNRDSSTKEPIEFDVTSAEFISAYFKIHHLLEEDGIDFWWLDWQQGNISKKAGVDPLWVLNHFHFWDSGRKGQRPVTFTRYGGPGGHRYPIGFSGDTVSTWDSLKFQPEFTATAANVGFGWWSHDIGGHYGGQKDPEMFARWVQVGLWSPILRLHCTASAFNTREPWRYTEESRLSVTHSLQFRHRLIPYLYTMSVRSAKEGICLVEPMYHRHPIADEAYTNKTQYFFGSELLVAPITAKRDYVTLMGQTEVWLPEGQWVDIFSNTVYDGNRLINMFRVMEQIPVLAQPGAIIPLDLAGAKGFDEKTVNDTPIPTAIEIVLVVGADGHFDLLEDDGKGAELAAIKFSKTPIKYDQAKGRLSIGPTTDPLVKKREYRVSAPALEHGSEFAPSITGARLKHVGKENGQTVLHLETVSTDQVVHVDLGASPKLRENDLSSTDSPVFWILDRAEIAPETKSNVWELFEAAAGGKVKRHVLVSQIEGSKLGEELTGALLEHVLAA